MTAVKGLCSAKNPVGAFMNESGSQTNRDFQLLEQRLGSEIAASLDERQCMAVQEVIRATNWSSRHALNIRLSIPFFSRRYYLTVVGGQERRTHMRRREERALHPLRTLSNILFAVMVVGGATMLALFLLAFYSSIIEF